ncbi:TPA: glycosyltransferase [Photobacterium damselae]
MEIKKLSAPLNEDEIKQHWKYKDKIYISCVCITFNQKDYIRDTIDSFLAQETEYRFEIVIHDDVSTDGTRDILLEYKEKYPSIIKLVLQDENQYKKGRKITPLAVSHATGEYVALCEGDDFWIDKQKLQKQIVALKNNKNINLVISKALSFYPDGMTSVFCDLGSKKKIIPFEECILGPKKDFFPTASFFLRKRIFDELPDWFYSDAPIGDYYIQLFSAKYSGVIYLSEVTTVYRRDAVGSWSVNNSNKEYKMKCLRKRFLCKIKLKDEFGFKYNKVLAQRVYLSELIFFMINIISTRNKIKNIKCLFSLIYEFPLVLYYIAMKIINKAKR